MWGFFPLYIHDGQRPVVDLSTACDYERPEREIVTSVSQIHQNGTQSSVSVRRGVEVAERCGRSRMRGLSGRDV